VASSRRPLLSALGVASVLGVFAAWSGLFVYLAFAPSAFVPFRPWLDRSAEAGLALAWAGIVPAAAAQCLMWAAIVTMGRAWRMGIDDKSPGALVTRGVFRLSRNPIFPGLDAAAVSGFLIQPNWVVSPSSPR
jgi:protein-S-isoprenylcysteine O-methyltransferase Ste14